MTALVWIAAAVAVAVAVVAVMGTVAATLLPRGIRRRQARGALAGCEGRCLVCVLDLSFTTTMDLTLRT